MKKTINAKLNYNRAEKKLELRREDLGRIDGGTEVDNTIAEGTFIIGATYGAVATEALTRCNPSNHTAEATDNSACQCP